MVSVPIDKDVVAPNCVNSVRHMFVAFSDVRNVLDVTQQCENGGRTKYRRFDISTYYLGVNFSENSLNFYSLKSRGWGKQVMWMG